MVLTTIAGMAGISFAVFVLQILEKAANDPGVIKTHYQVSFGLAIGTCILLIALFYALSGLLVHFRYDTGNLRFNEYFVSWFHFAGGYGGLFEVCHFRNYCFVYLYFRLGLLI